MARLILRSRLAVSNFDRRIKQLRFGYRAAYVAPFEIGHDELVKCDRAKRNLQ